MVKFYRCNTCGNIITKLIDSGVPVSCCGEAMEELKPGSVDAALEKHVPHVTVDGADVNVQVGEVAHPMLEEHHIAFVVLETTSGCQVKRLNAGDEPVAHFTLAKGDKAVAVYEYCNLHGLWVKEM